MNSTARSVKTSSLAKPLLEAVLVRLAESEKFISPQSLLKRAEKISDGSVPGSGQKKKHSLTADRPDRPEPRQARPQAQAQAQTQTQAPPAAQTQAQTSQAPPDETPANVPAPAPAPRPVILSSDEKNSINSDPAVRTIVEHFNGEVVDISKRIVSPLPEDE